MFSFHRPDGSVSVCSCRASNAALLLLAAALIAAPAAWATPLLVTGDDTLTLTADDSPLFTPGASIGSSVALNTFETTSGTLIVEGGVEWTNDGYFYVGSCGGAACPNATGTVDFLSGSLFNSNATGLSESPAGKVSIGENGTGTVTLHEGATWNHSGPSNQFTFTVGAQGALLVQGELDSNSATGVSGLATVDGADARWTIAGSLDVSVFGSAGAGSLEVTGGAFVQATFTDAAFGSNQSGQIYVGGGFIPEQGSSGFDDDDDDNGFDVDPVYSNLNTAVLDIGTFSGSEGTVTVENFGRIDATQRIWLGRSGGAATLIVNEGGEVLVGGRSGSSFAGQVIQLWEDGTIDLSGGGKVVVGTDTPQIANPPPPFIAPENAFADIDEGTLLVGHGGELKGSGLVIGDILVNGGKVAPGNSIGELFVQGDFSLLDGELVLEIASATAFDRLNVSGVLALGGTLTLAFIDGFSPGQGEAFELDLFSALAIEGMFSSVQSTGLAEGLLLNLDAAALAAGQPVSFAVVPIPAAAWLFASALGLLVWRSRNRGQTAISA